MRVWTVVGVFLAAAAVIACAPAPEVTGARLYAEFCAGCHGPEGLGDGTLAADLETAPADLTLIAHRNGGVFPMAEVMSTIDGYTRRLEGRATMPEFGAALQEGPLVLVDTGDGIRTQTPERLVALAEYLRSIQRMP